MSGNRITSSTDNADLSDLHRIEQEQKMIKDLLPGYKVCSTPSLHDACPQTDLMLDDIDDLSEFVFRDSIGVAQDHTSVLANTEDVLANADQPNEAYLMPDFIGIKFSQKTHILLKDTKKTTIVNLNSELLDTDEIILKISEWPIGDLHLSVGGYDIFPVTDQSLPPYIAVNTEYKKFSLEEAMLYGEDPQHAERERAAWRQKERRERKMQGPADNMTPDGGREESSEVVSDKKRKSRVFDDRSKDRRKYSSIDSTDSNYEKVYAKDQDYEVRSTSFNIEHIRKDSLLLSADDNRSKFVSDRNISAKESETSKARKKYDLLDIPESNLKQDKPDMLRPKGPRYMPDISMDKRQDIPGISEAKANMDMQDVSRTKRQQYMPDKAKARQYMQETSMDRMQDSPDFLEAKANKEMQDVSRTKRQQFMTDRAKARQYIPDISMDKTQDTLDISKAEANEDMQDVARTDSPDVTLTSETYTTSKRNNKSAKITDKLQKTNDKNTKNRGSGKVTGTKSESGSSTKVTDDHFKRGQKSASNDSLEEQLNIKNTLTQTLAHIGPNSLTDDVTESNKTEYDSTLESSEEPTHLISDKTGSANLSSIGNDEARDRTRKSDVSKVKARTNLNKDIPKNYTSSDTQAIHENSSYARGIKKDEDVTDISESTDVILASETYTPSNPSTEISDKNLLQHKTPDFSGGSPPGFGFQNDFLNDDTETMRPFQMVRDLDSLKTDLMKILSEVKKIHVETELLSPTAVDTPQHDLSSLERTHTITTTVPNDWNNQKSIPVLQNERNESRNDSGRTSYSPKLRDTHANLLEIQEELCRPYAQNYPSPHRSHSTPSTSRDRKRTSMKADPDDFQDDQHLSDNSKN